MLIQRWIRGTVALLGLALASCATTLPDEPASDDVQPVASEPEARSVLDPDADPNVRTVFECTITGNWWGTRESCVANCAGGKCFVCGLTCQN
jgi:hypothetical protein